MPAVPPYIIGPVWEQFEAPLPERRTSHPPGCHRPRIPDLHAGRWAPSLKLRILRCFRVFRVPGILEDASSFTKVGKQGEIPLPEGVREEARLKGGDLLFIEANPNGGIVLRPWSHPPGCAPSSTSGEAGISRR